MLTKKLIFDADDLAYIDKLFKRNPLGFFKIPEFRAYFAKKRWGSSTPTVNEYAAVQTGSQVTEGTISHNRWEFESSTFGSVTRTQRLYGALSAVSPVYEEAHALKLLSIGPRTEMEVFHAMSIGFSPTNIAAIDLLSYSEYITLGDMHAISHSDASFDVVVLSWVLNYSSDPRTVLRECFRVLRSNGILAIGLTHNHKNPSHLVVKKSDPTFIDGSSFRCVDDLISIFPPNIKTKIVFQQEPEDCKANRFILLLRRLPQT